jgi:hypothetical protein
MTDTFIEVPDATRVLSDVSANSYASVTMAHRHRR